MLMGVDGARVPQKDPKDPKGPKARKGPERPERQRRTPSEGPERKGVIKGTTPATTRHVKFTF